MLILILEHLMGMFFDSIELEHTHVDERHGIINVGGMKVVMIHAGIIHAGFLPNFVRADHREMQELKGG